MEKRKGNSLIIILAILLLISISVVGYFYLQTHNLKEGESVNTETQGSNIGSNTAYTSPTPDILISQIKISCEKRDYKTVTFNSVKNEGGKYQLINGSDISGENEELSYLGAARSLCSVVASNATIEKMKISDTEWDYRYVFSPEIKSGYTIVFINGEWKFVLYKPMRL